MGENKTKLSHGGDRPISILLIESNPLFRMGLAELIKREPGLVLVPVANPVAAVPDLRHATRPDIVLLDIDVSDPPVLEALRRYRADDPEAKVIVMGVVPIESDVLSFVKGGVSGFVLKDASLEDLTTSIRAVAAEGKVLPPSLIASLFCQIVSDAQGRCGFPPSGARMTAREREIVELIADGLSNKEIGSRLCIATDTVKSHVHNILEKLSLRSRVEVAARARDRASSKN